MVRVAILALEDCYISSMSSMTTMLGLANRINRAQHEKEVFFAWEVVSLTGGTVSTGSGIDVVSAALNGNTKYDVICIPTIYYESKERFEKQIARNQPLYPWLKAQWELGATIAASGTGVFLLAETGLLDSRKATIPPWLSNRFSQRYRMIRLQSSALITEDKRLLCCSSVTAHVRLAQRLIETFIGPKIAFRCAQAILIDAGLAADDTQMPQYVASASHSPLMTHVDHWIDRHIAERLGTNEMASAMAMSPRTLHRRLMQEINMSPANYIQLRRMELAKQQLEITAISVGEIAQRVGYSDSSAFTRVFTKSYGLTPTQYRERHKMAIP